MSDYRCHIDPYTQFQTCAFTLANCPFPDRAPLQLNEDCWETTATGVLRGCDFTPHYVGWAMIASRSHKSLRRVYESLLWGSLGTVSAWGGCGLVRVCIQVSYES